MPFRVNFPEHDIMFEIIHHVIDKTVEPVGFDR